MLIGDGERPRRSGLDGIIGSCTNQLVVAARRVVRELWEAHEDDIRRSCRPHLPIGLIDEMDVLAYVLADALGRPLPHPDDTNKFGKKVAMQAARVEARLVDAERQADGAVRKASAAAAANPTLLPRVQAARDARAVATGKILNALYDPKPPDRTVGAKRKIDETIPLRRAQAALRTAEQQVRRTRHELDKLGPLPDVDLPEDMDDEAGEAAAWRRWEREREMRERAMQAFAAAEQHEIQKMKEEMSARHHYHNEQERRMQAEWSRQRAEEYGGGQAVGAA